MKKGYKLKILIFFALFLFQLIVPNTCAEILNMEKDLSIELDNDTIYIRSDGIDYSKTLTTYTDSSNETHIDEWTSSVEFNWYQNVTCNVETDLTDIRTKMTNLTSLIGEVVYNTDYYEEYVSCNSNLSGCIQYKADNENAQVERDTCNNILTSAKTELIVKQSVIEGLNETKVNCEIDNQNKQGWLSLGWILAVAGIIGCIFMYMRFVKKVTSRNKDPDSDSGRGYDF